MTTKPNGRGNNSRTPKKRTRLVRPYPIHTLEDSLAIAEAIQNSNSGLPFARTMLAQSMDMSVGSSAFTQRLNSSAKYGLTDGGYKATQIALTDLGKSAVSPNTEKERTDSLRRSAMLPETFSGFYRMLDGRPLPEDEFARNILEREFKISQELSDECLGIIKANGLSNGIVHDEGGALIVRLPKGENIQPAVESTPTPIPNITETTTRTETREPEAAPISTRATSPQETTQPTTDLAKIFVGSTGDAALTTFVESVLGLFGIPHRTVRESDTSTGPVSPQVSEGMKSCGSAILVVGSTNNTAHERSGSGASGVLYQLGAASVLYGNRILIVCQPGTDLGFETGAISVFESDGTELSTDGLNLLKALQLASVVSLTA